MFDVSKIKTQISNLSEMILNKMYPNSSFDNEERREKAINDIEWMLTFIIEGFKAKSTKIVSNLISWFKELFIGLDIDPSHAELLFKTTKEVLIETFKDKDLEAYLSDVKMESKSFNDFIEKDNPYQKQQEKYLSYLLESEKEKAKDLIHGMVEQGIPIQDIYLYVFQVTMRQVGELWQHSEIHVGREHYCTAVTQLIMSSLYEYIMKPHVDDKRIMACAVGSELHEIGIRMVADFFEMSGWETTYLGANLPSNQVINYALDFQPHVIALSISMPYHIGILKETIQKIKSHNELKDIKILVGGIPFLKDPGLYHYVGADAVALDAKEGVKIANRLLS